MVKRYWFAFPLACLTLILILSGAALGNQFIDVRQLQRAGPSDRITVTGINHRAEPAHVIVRIDDERSHDYWTRVNIERLVPSGPFRFSLSVNSLRTPRGRSIDRQHLRLAKVFTVPGGGVVELEHVAVIQSPSYRSAYGPVWALDLGPASAPVAPGFVGLSVGDQRLHGRSLMAHERPGPGPLIGDGIEGIERLRLMPGPGRWTVALWIDDPGDWEYLPHHLERRIRINGATVYDRRPTPREWIRSTYHAGREIEWRPGTDPWTLFGHRRGGLVVHEVQTEDGIIEVEFAGHPRSATFLAGLVIAPAADTGLLAQIQRARADLFNDTWRVGEAEHLGLASGGLSIAVQQPLAAARGTPTVVTATVRTDVTVERPSVTVVPPTNGHSTLEVWPLAGFWRLTRPDTAATLLIPNDTHLMGERLDLPLYPDLPRRYRLVTFVSADAEPGIYRGTLTVDGVTVPFSVEVLDLELPAASVGTGVYYDDWPYHRWFRTDPRSERDCAYRTLRALGLTTVAPALPTPVNNASAAELAAEMAAVRELGFRAHPLAYTPLKRLQWREDWKQRLRTAVRTLDAAGLSLLWSAADEASNTGANLDRLREKLQAIRDAVPNIALAGHLNAERDDQIAASFDAVFVNSGYGLTEARLHPLKRGTLSVSLYNMGRMRLAAGAYLWRTGLDGYLQWHGRMPTADPFDPTDGREADVMLLPPTAVSCPTVPDLDLRLLELAEGVLDHRWLQWLDQHASQNSEAALLRQELKGRIAWDWERTRTVPDGYLSTVRTRIAVLARISTDNR